VGELADRVAALESGRVRLKVAGELKPRSCWSERLRDCDEPAPAYRAWLFPLYSAAGIYGWLVHDGTKHWARTPESGWHQSDGGYVGLRELKGPELDEIVREFVGRHNIAT
jgi:hypothetical protein